MIIITILLCVLGIIFIFITGTYYNTDSPFAMVIVLIGTLCIILFSYIRGELAYERGQIDYMKGIIKYKQEIKQDTIYNPIK